MTDLIADVTVTNLIQSGAGFATKHGSGESCYIPATVVHATGVKPGDIVKATLVHNPAEDVQHRTPYLVTYVRRAEPVQLHFDLDEPKPTTSVDDFVRQTMREGGVWTVARLFQEYKNDDEARRSDDVTTYNRISTVLRDMYGKGECSKWSFYRSSAQTKPGKEWFSCFPDRVDVDEFE